MNSLLLFLILLAVASNTFLLNIIARKLEGKRFDFTVGPTINKPRKKT